MSASVSSTNGDAQSEPVPSPASDDEQSVCISEATLGGSGEHSLVEVNDLIKRGEISAPIISRLLTGH